jgi:hypothetical protein
MSEKEGCSCPTPKEHQAHMCQLKHEGRMEEIDRYSDKPKFACNKCGSKANGEEFLCQPRPL